MAVYTKLEKEEINSVLLNYKLGKLKRFEGIKDGIENTNYFIETEKGKYILTIYERRVKENDLPFFRTLHSYAFNQLGMTKEKMMKQEDYKEFGQNYEIGCSYFF